MAVREVKVTILGDVKGFQKALTAAGVDADKLGVKFNTTATKVEQSSSRISTAGNRIGRTFSGLTNIAGSFGVPFVGQLALISSGLEQMDARTTTSMGKLASVGKAAVIGITAAAVAIGVVGVKAAMDEEKATARLISAVKNVHESYTKLEPAIAKVSESLIKLGFEDTATHSALAKLIPTVGSTAKALDLMGLAADIARARNMSLEEATTLLAKVTTGHVALLGRLGIATKDAAGNTLTQEAALQKLSDMFGGAAQEHAGTFAGKLDTLKAEGDKLAETVGNFLIPILEKMGAILVEGVTFLENHKLAVIALGAAIAAVLIPAMVAYAIAAYNAAAANIAATWEFIAVGAAIAAVATGVYLLITRWDEFKAWMSANIPLFTVWLASVTASTLAVKDAAVWVYNVFADILDIVKGVVRAVGNIHIPDLNPLHALGFAEGGMVPGPIGSPHLAVVHGGEQVLTPEQQRSAGMNVTQNIYVSDRQTPNEIVRRLRSAQFLSGR